MEKYYSPAQVCELIPGLTVGNLAQMRYRGVGPRFIKVSPRRVTYSASAIAEYMRSQERQSTGERVSA